ncbi:hypothetical protein IM793_08750 [Pedobacter sp. MR2016-19]|jgi:CO dehydrogenase/acetyl-CoA synthase delta subunit|uniref:hypothetical protein n=1 Tax=unclassified Pedobacter TaxID=2628915 RepID=UPI00104B8E4B|nr:MULTISPECIES: hypothetical protein [unclassified Pedobacter]MBE5319243.1 hypothetical protein [Pedobacter sp. MR2016-19]QXU40258.1 hypothetical protein KYH19_14705 [Pedobacter sp. D749]
MTLFVKNLQTVDGLISNLYKDVSVEEMTKKVTELMEQQGYQVTNDQFGNLILEKGSRIKRLLLGAFATYFKFSVTMSQSTENELTVNIFQQSSGMSGGLIGMNQIKTELARLNFLFSNI